MTNQLPHGSLGTINICHFDVMNTNCILLNLQIFSAAEVEAPTSDTTELPLGPLGTAAVAMRLVLGATQTIYF